MNERKIEVFAPAKINLYLHIVGKRPDGFHELETLMVPISVGDVLHVALTERPGIELTCDRADLAADKSNLVYRAAALFLEKYGVKEGVRIHLEKKTPIGAGLGGGSSDAAHTLLALRQLTGAAASDEDLAALAATLGSDVPFFIYKKPAVCKGRGEIIEPCVLKDSYEGLLVHPGFGVSTPWAYQAYAAAPKKGEEGPAFEFGPLRNDLEPPVFGKHLWLPTAKAWLASQPESRAALMSGSGSSVFALLKPGADAAALAERFKAEFGDTLFVSPFKVV
ncbi:MAG: 4-(cytidine 5'-diphospho)-2-C-methyl-D-erythritol kinase [Verrucomicrobium sp.]|nr:4-(cytidine 5'-diphospho)-2-C-methyl-D-erythritol kinase [Verrucomicrobium sp.]